VLVVLMLMLMLTAVLTDAVGRVDGYDDVSFVVET